VNEHDNAPILQARLVPERYDEHESEVLPWPAQSPNVDIIEPLWGVFSISIP